MTSPTIPFTAGTALVILVIAVGTPREKALVTSPCRTATDTAAMAQNTVRQITAFADSAGTLQPSAVSVALVTDSTACQAAVDAYNASLAAADSHFRIGSGFLVRAVVPTADTLFALYIPGETGEPATVAHFSKRFQLQLVTAGLK